jgi:hypothetical protein
LTWTEWLADKLWLPVILVVTGLTVAWLASSKTRATKRSVGMTIGSVIVGGGLTYFTLGLWGLGGLWIVMLAGVGFSVPIWRSARTSRWLAVLLVFLANGWTIALLGLVAYGSSTGSRET